jgi:putative ABC transport system ATP-binding protein
MSTIITTDLHKVYSEIKIPVNALNGISIKIEEAEFTAIVGPSGSGKTTLLNMLGGLDTPSSGEVHINGTNITSLPSRKLIDFRLHNIGFVFQSFNLIPVLNARENVEFILQLQGAGKKERQQRAIELLEAVGLQDKIDNRPGDLSGGQQQRIAVARALASKPRFILADEPTANLDSHSTSELLDIMMKMNEQYKTTFIFSTHDSRVMERARRIITIEDGMVAKDEIRK